MKVIFIGETDPLALINGKQYDVISASQGWYRIIDETKQEFLYPSDVFTIVNE